MTRKTKPVSISAAIGVVEVLLGVALWNLGSPTAWFRTHPYQLLVCISVVFGLGSLLVVSTFNDLTHPVFRLLATTAAFCLAIAPGAVTTGQPVRVTLAGVAMLAVGAVLLSHRKGSALLLAVGALSITSFVVAVNASASDVDAGTRGLLIYAVPMTCSLYTIGIVGIASGTFPMRLTRRSTKLLVQRKHLAIALSLKWTWLALGYSKLLPMQLGGGLPGWDQQAPELLPGLLLGIGFAVMIFAVIVAPSNPRQFSSAMNFVVLVLTGIPALWSVIRRDDLFAPKEWIRSSSPLASLTAFVGALIFVRARQLEAFFGLTLFSAWLYLAPRTTFRSTDFDMWWTLGMTGLLPIRKIKRPSLPYDNVIVLLIFGTALARATTWLSAVGSGLSPFLVVAVAGIALRWIQLLSKAWTNPQAVSYMPAGLDLWLMGGTAIVLLSKTLDEFVTGSSPTNDFSLKVLVPSVGLWALARFSIKSVLVNAPGIPRDQKPAGRLLQWWMTKVDPLSFPDLSGAQQTLEIAVRRFECHELDTQFFVSDESASNSAILGEDRNRGSLVWCDIVTQYWFVGVTVVTPLGHGNLTTLFSDEPILFGDIVALAEPEGTLITFYRHTVIDGSHTDEIAEAIRTAVRLCGIVSKRGIGPLFDLFDDREIAE
jgi:hypothetical protein